MAGGGTLRRMGQDPEMAGQQLSPGIKRRTLGFARPYARLVLLFVLLVATASVLAVAPPLLFKEIIDRGVPAASLTREVRSGA